MSTPNLAIVHIQAAQNQKEVTANTAFDDLDLALTSTVTETVYQTPFPLPLTDALQNMVFHFVGPLSPSIAGAVVITLPSNKKLYIVTNQTSESLIFQTQVAGRMAVVNENPNTSIPSFDYTILYCDGINVDVIASSFPAASAGAFGGDIRKTGSYAAQSSDAGQIITFDSSSAATYTLLSPPASATWAVFVRNINTGAVTISRNGLNIDGKAQNVILYQGDAALITTEGVNYFQGMARPLSIAAFAPGVGANSQVLLYVKLDRPCIFPASAPNSYAVANTAATGSTTFTFKKNSSAFATVVFSGSGTTGAWTQASDASFAAGDILELDGPATADATLANIGFTLQGYRF